MSKLARSALIIWLTIPFGVTAAAQALSTKKPNATAAAPSDFSQKIDDATKLREQREQDIIKMIDVLRADLFKLIEEAKSGGEQRSTGLLQKMNDLQGLLSKQIDDSKTIGETRASGLAQRIDDLKTSVDDLKKGIPPWVAIVVSAVIAILGFCITLGIAAWNRSRADKDRTEDINRANTQRMDDITQAGRERIDDINRSDKQRTEDSDRADQRRTQDIQRADAQRGEDIKRLEQQLDAQRAEMKRSAVYSLRHEWGQLHNDISAARGYFAQPSVIDQKAYSLIVKIGNWYDMFARRYTDGSLDKDLAGELKEQAKGFLKEVQKAREALVKGATPINSNFKEELSRWQDLGNL